MAKKEQEEVKKNWFRRHYIITIVLGLLLIFFGIGIMNPSSDISENENAPSTTSLYFYDALTNCSLNGEVSINEQKIGTATKGYISISPDDYITKISAPNSTISVFGRLGSCFGSNTAFFYDLTWIPNKNITKEQFSDWEVLNFYAEIDQENLRSPWGRAMIGFVRPSEASEFVSTITLQGTEQENIVKIAKYLDSRFTYMSDEAAFGQPEYWMTPTEVLVKHEGDCEDWTNTFLSSILYYKPSLKCYNIVLSTHVTNFCYLGNGEYSWIDQSKVQQFTKIDPSYSEQEKLILMREFMNNYFDKYGIRNNVNAVRFAYTDKEFIEFKDTEDFVSWAIRFLG